MVLNMGNEGHHSMSLLGPCSCWGRQSLLFREGLGYLGLGLRLGLGYLGLLLGNLRLGLRLRLRLLLCNLLARRQHDNPDDLLDQLWLSNLLARWQHYNPDNLHDQMLSPFTLSSGWRVAVRHMRQSLIRCLSLSKLSTIHSCLGRQFIRLARSRTLRRQSLIRCSSLSKLSSVHSCSCPAGSSSGWRAAGNSP